jgi:hypothetical protein
MVAASNHRAAHVSCDGRTSSKMRVGAMRMYVSDVHISINSVAFLQHAAVASELHAVRSYSCDSVRRCVMRGIQASV